MAAVMFKTTLAYRFFSVFRGSPLVCAQKKVGIPRDDAPLQEPKMPLRPFASFLKKSMDDLKQEHPDAKHKDLMVMASDLWKKLPESEKKKFNTQFQSEYQEYVNTVYQYYQQTKNFDSSNTDDLSQPKRSILKALQSKMGKPRAPKSALINFAIEHARSLGKPFVIPVGIVEGRKQWDKLTQFEKNKYITEAKMEREKYQEDLLKWEKKMLEDGHDLLVRVKSIKQLKNLTALDP